MSPANKAKPIQRIRLTIARSSLGSYSTFLGEDAQGLLTEDQATSLPHPATARENSRVPPYPSIDSLRTWEGGDDESKRTTCPWCRQVSGTSRGTASTLTAAAIVSPPGLALRVFPLNVGDSAAPLLTVGDEGGRLDLILPEKPKDAGMEEMSLWVFQNGLPLPFDVLSRWIAGHGRNIREEKLAIPDLAPGDYRACIAARAVLAQWQASGFAAPLARCTAGQLMAGGSLQLDLSPP